jgi:hypothetical protein
VDADEEEEALQADDRLMQTFEDCGYITRECEEVAQYISDL